MTDPDTDIEVIYQRALAAARGGDYAAAAQAFDQVVATDPARKHVQGMAVYAAMRACNWARFDEKVEALLRGVDAGLPVTMPSILFSLPASAAQQRLACETYFSDLAPAGVSACPTPPSGARIRLGYFSADFESHAISHLTSAFFAAHDRGHFEVFAFATQGDPNDRGRKKITGAVDRLINVAGQSADEVAALSRKLGIQIALDLNIYIAGVADIFARRAAPVQVNFLGYPGTSGAPCYDYIIGDDAVTPSEHREWFSEHVVTMPHTYQVNSLRSYNPLRTFSRAELDLPERAFVFCCFNDTSKITPDVFAIWMRLLQAVDGSVLWLLDAGPAAIRNLQNEARAGGVDPNRLIFAPRMPVPDHLARHQAADLFLDTFYYGAHTTASDALWAGLPLVTRLGDAFPGRVAAGLLNAAWLPELVADSSDAYESMALALATDPAWLADVRGRLAQNRARCPLFDTARYTRNIERAYTQMWERHTRGDAPANLDIRDVQVRG